ncbi:hypothetical protein Efla_007292 [Eimeria flavescens]
MDESNCRCVLSSRNAPPHAQSMPDRAFTGSSPVRCGQLIVLEGESARIKRALILFHLTPLPPDRLAECLVVSVGKAVNVALLKHFSRICACAASASEGYGRAASRLVCVTRGGEIEPSTAASISQCPNCGRKNTYELSPLEQLDACRDALASSLLPKIAGDTDPTVGLIQISFIFSQADDLLAGDPGSERQQESAAMAGDKSEEGRRFFSFPRRPLHRLSLPKMAFTCPRASRFSEEQKKEWRFLFCTVPSSAASNDQAASFGRKPKNLRDLGFSLALLISIASSRSSGCKMSEPLSTLSSGSRWFETECSKWRKHVTLPLNAVGAGAYASQGSHMSGRTNTTVQMMTKPVSEEVRAMHILLVADDERKVLQELEAMLLNGTSFIVFDPAKHATELLLHVQEGVALVNLSATSGRQQKRLARWLEPFMREPKRTVRTLQILGIPLLFQGSRRPAFITDARRVPGNLAKELINQFDFLVVTPTVNKHFIFSRSAGWKFKQTHCHRTTQFYSHCRVTDAAQELFVAYVNAASRKSGITCRATRVIAASAAVIAKILERRCIDTLDVALGALVCELTAMTAWGDYLSANPKEGGTRSALYAFNADDPDFIARRLIAFLADLEAAVVLDSD